MKGKINAFISDLIMYDYLLFGGAFVLFILFIILGLVLRKKIGIAIFLILLAFTTLLVAPTFGYVKMHEYLFKNDVAITSQKRLEFTDAIVVRGTLTNTSKFYFKSCRIKVNVHKVSKNAIKNYLFQFKTIKKMSIIEESIEMGQTKTFKMIVEPFTYSRNYDLTLKADCR